MKELLSSAEFAALCQVEKRTLFYYDEIGLLKPYQVKQNGYRIYHYTQFDDMSMIKAMQVIGMSLNEIKALSKIKDQHSYQEILQLQIKRLEKKQAQLKQAQAMLDNANQNVIQYQKYGCDQPFITELSFTAWKLIPLQTPFVNYITAIDSGSGNVILRSFDEPLTLCKTCNKKEDADYYDEGGSYFTIYLKRNNKTFHEMLKDCQLQAKKQGLQLTFPCYCQALTSHLLPCEELSDIFRLQIRIQN